MCATRDWRKMERVLVKEKETQKQKQVHTTTTTTSQPEATPYSLLEPVEEKVIRMRYGLSEADDKKLEYALGASEDTRIRVTLMEAGNIQALDGDVPVAAGTDSKALLRFVTSRNTDI